jgi:hypothetical protein
MDTPNTQVLSVGEFQRSMKALERSINARFDDTDQGIREVRDDIRLHGERLAVLEEFKKSETKKNLSVATVLTVVIAATGEILKRILG